MLECVVMPLPLRFVPRASCLSSAYLLSVYEDCDWFCMAWRAGSGNRRCLPSCIGFEMGMYCIMDSSSGSLRRSLCVSFVVVCEDCAVSLLCWVRSVCFPFLSCTSSLSVCSWLFALFLSWCLSSACFCQRLLCMCCACAVPLQFSCCASAIHRQFTYCASSVRALSNKRLSNQHSPLFHSHLPHSQFLQPGSDEVVSLVAGVLQKGGQRRGGRHHPFPFPLQITHPLRGVAGDGEVELVEIGVEHGGGLVGMW